MRCDCKHPPLSSSNCSRSSSSSSSSTRSRDVNDERPAIIIVSSFEASLAASRSSSPLSFSSAPFSLPFASIASRSALDRVDLPRFEFPFTRYHLCIRQRNFLSGNYSVRYESAASERSEVGRCDFSGMLPRNCHLDTRYSLLFLFICILLVLICRNLPFHSAGGLVTAVAPVVISGNGIWVGWPGMHMENPDEPIPESDPNDRTPTAGLLSRKVNLSRFNLSAKIRASRDAIAILRAPLVHRSRGFANFFKR